MDIRKDLMDLDDVFGGTTLMDNANNLIGQCMVLTGKINMEIKNATLEIENITKKS
jgi:hypothetical protein